MVVYLRPVVPPPTIAPRKRAPQNFSERVQLWGLWVAALGSLATLGGLAVSVFAIIHLDRQAAPRISIDVRPAGATTRYVNVTGIKACEVRAQLIVTVSNIGGRNLTVDDVQYKGPGDTGFKSLIDRSRVKARLGPSFLPAKLAQGNEIVFETSTRLGFSAGQFPSTLSGTSGGDQSEVRATTNVGATATAFVGAGVFRASCRPTERP